MQTEQFKTWLTERYPTSETTVNNRLANCKNVERYYGDLDEHYQRDKCNTIIEELTYGIDDERANRPQRHVVKIEGNIRNGSATLKQAIKLYVQFKELLNEEHDEQVISNVSAVSNDTKDFKIKLQDVVSAFHFDKSIHKDVAHLQIDLCEHFKKNLSHIEWVIEHKPSLSAKDSIDIYGYDKETNLNVVVELDAHRADQVAKKFLSRTSLLLEKNVAYISYCYPGTDRMPKNECYKYFEYCRTISDFIEMNANVRKIYIGFMVS